jgi:hypothetical protein
MPSRMSWYHRSCAGGCTSRHVKIASPTAFLQPGNSMPFSLSSNGRLTDRDLDRFPGTSLVDRLPRAVCHAGCLRRKELYEAGPRV